MLEFLYIAEPTQHIHAHQAELEREKEIGSIPKEEWS
jgi:hypothetical protein